MVGNKNDVIKNIQIIVTTNLFALNLFAKKYDTRLNPCNTNNSNKIPHAPAKISFPKGIPFLFPCI